MPSGSPPRPECPASASAPKRETVLERDRPWEHDHVSYMATMQDGDKLRAYVAYTRGKAGTEGSFIGPSGGRGGVRWIRRTTSKDFRTWSPPEDIDAGDTPFDHLYTNSCVACRRAPGTYLMFPSRFVPERELTPGWHGGSGVSDIVFMSSRDGIRFDRSFMEALIRPGPDQDNWHERGLYIDPGLIQTSLTELSVYGSEHWRLPTVRIVRYTFRTDGFVSLNMDADLYAFKFNR